MKTHRWLGLSPCINRKQIKLKLQAAMNGPSQAPHIRLWHHWIARSPHLQVIVGRKQAGNVMSIGYLSDFLCPVGGAMDMTQFCFVCFLAFSGFIDRIVEECDRKQGKRGGVTCSKGTGARSRTQVRCRASAHGPS